MMETAYSILSTLPAWQSYKCTA